MYKEVEIYNMWFEKEEDHTQANILNAIKTALEFSSGNNGKPILNNSLPTPSDCDLERLYEWIIDEKRRPAKIAFTSGSLRKVANEIEFRLWRQ